jgi:molybdate-binding protein/DNA-binding transcriptional regulator YhcF (GntR family)
MHTAEVHRFGLQISKTSDDPLYRQIADQIRERIARGELAPGDPLPTVRGLAEELGCNPSTVSRAYAELVREGVIAGQRGAGTRVARPPLPDNETLRQARLVNLVERPLLEALSAGYTPAEVEAAFTLALSRWRELREGGVSSAHKAARPNELRFVGSHDPAVELLATRLRRHDPSIRLSVTFAGSLGGLMALARGEADVAGAHLRDEQTGEYNVDYVRHILPGRPVVLVTLVTRSVGLMAAAGNPKEISGIEDLARPDVTIINRQAGSGTRVLLDARLREREIMSSDVAGYNREATTHIAVATAVARGEADVGLGVRAAAQALGLDFVPLLRERYDLVIPEETWSRPPVRSMLTVIQSGEFQAAVQALGGYDVSEMGHEVRLR